MTSKIEEIESLIAKKEAQLVKAERESEAWNAGKYKTSSNAQMSKIMVSSLKKEIANLYIKLEQAKSAGA